MICMYIHSMTRIRTYIREDMNIEEAQAAEGRVLFDTEIHLETLGGM